MLELIVYILTAIFLTELIGYNLLVFLLSGWRQTRQINEYPLVSVVIPAYNEEKFIERKVKNIFELDYPRNKLEVIVINDESTDNTENIVKKLQRRYRNLKLVSHGIRKGQAAAFNTGVRNSKGKFILLSDADSILDRNVLINALQSFDHDIGAVCGRVKEVMNQGLIGRINSLSWLFRGLYQSAEGRIDSTIPVFTPVAFAA